METLYNFYTQNFDILWKIALSGFLIPIVIYIYNCNRKDRNNWWSEYSPWTIGVKLNTFCFWLSWPIILLYVVIMGAYGKNIKSEWVETINYELISLQSSSNMSINGQIDGSTALSFGSIHGTISGGVDYKYSFYVKQQDGLIKRMVIDHKFVSFKDSEDRNVVQTANCYTCVDGRSYYNNSNPETRFQYVISVPLDKFDQHISVTH